MSSFRAIFGSASRVEGAGGFEDLASIDERRVGVGCRRGRDARNFFAWVQSIYTCGNEKAWGILLASLFFVPIGVIKGFGIWFGFWPHCALPFLVQ